MTTDTGFSERIDAIVQPLFGGNSNRQNITPSQHKAALTELKSIAEDEHSTALEQTEAADALYNLMYHPDADTATEATNIVVALSRRPDAEVSGHAKSLAVAFVKTIKSVRAKTIERTDDPELGPLKGFNKAYVIDQAAVKVALTVALPYSLTEPSIGDGDKDTIRSVYDEYIRTHYNQEQETKFRKEIDEQAAAKMSYDDIRAEVERQFHLSDAVKVGTTFMTCAPQQNSQCGPHAVKNCVAMRNEELLKQKKSGIASAPSLQDPISKSPLFKGELENIPTDRAAELLEAFLGEFAPIAVLSYGDYKNIPVNCSTYDNQSVQQIGQQIDFGMAELQNFRNKHTKHFELVLNLGGETKDGNGPSNGHYIAVQGVWKDADHNEIEIRIADSLKINDAAKARYEHQVKELLKNVMQLEVL